jgi:hypothetical protein
MVKPESAFRDGQGAIGSIMHTAASKGRFQLRPVLWACVEATISRAGICGND